MLYFNSLFNYLFISLSHPIIIDLYDLFNLLQAFFIHFRLGKRSGSGKRKMVRMEDVPPLENTGLAGICLSCLTQVKAELTRLKMRIFAHLLTSSIFAAIGLMGSASPVFSQASTITSQRLPIVVYDNADLNPKDPGYEWGGATLLQNIRVIDGLGNDPVEGQDVLVDGASIVAVSATGSIDAPEGVREIKGTGLTVMPGLIDAHAHLVSGWRGGNDNGTRPVYVKWQLLTYLYAGVTQIYDIGNIPETAADARDIVEAGGWIGPDVKIAGTYFETASVGAVGANTLLLTPDASDVGANLDTMKDVFGVEMVKCHTGINAQILRTLVHEAHERDMRVVCDLWHNNGNPWIAAQTGLDGYAHNMFMSITPTERDAEILEELGTFVITTNAMLDVFGGYRTEQDGDFVTGNPLIEDVQPPSWVEQAKSEEFDESLFRYQSIFDAILGYTHEKFRGDALGWTKTMVDAGMLVGVGTDALYSGNWTGESMHRELELWVEGAGVSPLRTIQAATSDNARILKIDNHTGTIRPGLEADLLVVEGNPAENISDTRNIRYVFNNGKLVDRESLARQWKH